MTLRRSIFAALFLLGTTLTASHRLNPPVDPKTYHSPNSQFAFEVDPTDRDGRGEGKCRLTKAGAEVWAATLPFTFADAGVTEDGIVAGNGYTEGIQGFSRKGREAGPGDIRLAILDSHGAFRLDQTIPRRESRALHADPEPTISGIVLHPAAGRSTFRLQKAGGEQWSSYDLTTGKLVKQFKVPALGKAATWSNYVVGAKPVTGTPLTIVQCWHQEDAIGAVFFLLDPDGVEIWRHLRPGDYAIPHDEAAEDRLGALISEESAILETREPHRFELWFPRDGQRVRYTAAQHASGWEITEADRKPYTPPVEKKFTFPESPERPLSRLGSFKLGDAPPSPAIRDIREFGFDGAGRIGFIRTEPEEGRTFVLVDTTGKVLSEIPLPRAKEDALLATWLNDDRWVLVTAPYASAGKSRASWVDTATKQIREIPGFEVPRVDAVAATPDGGFIVLATRDERSTSNEELIAFDSDGKPRWKNDDNDYDHPGGLFSAEDITVTSRGEIALLDVIRHTVQLFDLQGEHLRTLDLDRICGKKSEYPCEIVADRAGGFFVYESPREALEWIKADGTFGGELLGKHPDGKALSVREARVAPDDSLWFTDGFAFIQIDKAGTVQKVVGPALDQASLGKIGSATADTHGRIYARDDRTGSVFVFDDTGKLVRKCQLSPQDFATYRDSALQVDNDGSIYLGHLPFAPNGEKLSAKQFGFDTIRAELRPRHAPAGFLVAGYHNAFLADQNGELLRTIERRPDRKWLHYPDAIVADDGSFVLEIGDRWDREHSLHFYTSNGDPLRSMQTPSGGLIGFNGKHAVFASDRDRWILDPSGKVMQHFQIPTKNPEECAEFLTKSGQELWVLDFTTRQVERYALPGNLETVK